jgi:transposase
MRYELSDYEWCVINPMLPNKPRGIPRVDRRVLNGIFGCCAPALLGAICRRPMVPRTTCYNRFVRWRRAGVWDQIMDALVAGHDAAVQMIDTSVVRVHQHGACIADNNHQDMGRSRGRLTSKFTRWWTPMACQSISPLRPVRRTTINCVRFFSARCSHKRCYSRIVDTTRTDQTMSACRDPI